MKQSVFRWLLCACILFTLLQSGHCVSRLFVDEFTGYTNELVTAKDVDTDLMIVDIQNVAGGVAATSTNSHTVDTPGSIGINTASSTISANQDLNIKSYGENVAFRGDEISLSANGDLVNNALHTSIVGDSIHLDGSNLLIDGEQTKLRTPGEIYFTSAGDIRFDTENKIQFLASEVFISSNATLSVNSELSNVHLESGDDFYIEGSDLFLIADSGVRILSEQDDLNIFSESTTNLFADNIQLDGISQSGVVSKNGTITANSIGINIDSDRTIAGASSISISADNPAADVDIISFGIVQSTSYLVSLFSQSIELQSSDQVKLTSEFDITFATIEDITNSADSINNKAFRDVSYVVDEGTLDLQFSGDVSFSSIDGDFNIETPFTLNLNSFDTEINAIESFSLSTPALVVSASNYIDFLSEGDMNVTATAFSLSASDSFEMFGRSSSALSASTSISFTSVNPLIVQSTEDIFFNGQTSVGSIYTANAQTIEYNSFVYTNIIASDDITFTATSLINIDTNGPTAFRARDMEFNSQYATIDALNTEIACNGLTIDSYLISFSTADIGLFSISTEQANPQGTTYDPANFVYDIVLSSASTLVYQAEGDVEWGSERLITFNYNTAFNMFGNDIAISVETDLTSNANSSTTFTAPVIYGLINTNIVSSNTISFVGATSFLAPTSRGDYVSLSSDDDIDYQFVSAEILGGMTHFVIDDSFTLNSGANIEFTTHNDKDIDITTGSAIFNSGDLLMAYGDELTYLSNSFSSNATNYNINSNLIHYRTTNFTMTGSSITINGENTVSQITFEADNANNFLSTKTFQLNFYDSLDFNAELSNTFRSNGILQFVYDGNTDIFGNTNINANGVQFSSNTDVHAIFHQISLNLKTNMAITAQTGFTIDATNNDRFISQNDIVLTSPQIVQANGGNIEIFGANTVDLNNPLGPVTIGSNLPEIAALNYSPVTVNAATLTGTSTTYFSATAGGNLETTDVGIYVGSTETPPLITLSSSASHNVYGNNGINVHASNNILSSSIQFQYFITENGFISATTFGARPSLTFTTAVSNAVVGGSIMFYSTNAGISTNSFGDISYTSTTGGFFSESSESGKIHTLYDTGAITVTSTLANNNFAISGDYTVSNGDANYREADFTVDAGRDVTIRSTTSDFRLHSLSQDPNDNVAIRLTANDPAPIIPNPNPNSFNIGATKEINYYPAGDVTQTAGGNAVFTASAGPYTFGTDQGDSTFNLDTVSYDSARDYNVTAGGVNGAVIADFDVTALTAASNFNVKSNYSTTVAATNNLVFSAKRNAHFFDDSEESGIYGNSGFSTSYISLSTTRTTGLNVTGHAITLSSGSVTNTLTTKYTIGQNNGEFNPQINGEVTSWTVNSVGSNSLTSSNHDVIINTKTFGFSSDVNTNIKAGGFLEFETTWDSLVAGQGILKLDADAGQFTATATNGYIDYNVRRNGVITSLNQASFLSSGGSSSSPISNGIVFSGTKGSISFTAGAVHNEDINAGATFDIGNGGFTATSTAGAVTLSASSTTGAGSIRSAGKIASTSTAATVLSTSSNNARMFFTTTGRSSPLAFAATDSMFVTGTADITLVADSAVSHFVKGNANIITGSNNNGQMNLDASGDIVYQGKSVSMTSTRDFYLAATGKGSMFDISALGSFSSQSTYDTYFQTDPNEGGSIRFSAIYETQLTFNSANTDITTDKDFNVITNGTLAFGGFAPMKTSVTGFIDIASNKSITLRADYAPTVTTSSHADIILHANDGDVNFGSTESTNFITGYQGYGNATFVIDDSASFTVQGNFSGPSTPLLVESALGDSIYYAKEGNLNADAYERLAFLAYGSTTDTGYVEFVARGTVGEGGDSYGIIVETTHTGGDIYMNGVGAVVTGFSVSFQALGTTSETGYISIINDYALGKGDRGSASPLIEFEDYPAVKFDSGTETLVKADTGDIRVNFGRRLFLRGGSVSALSSGGISFDVRGQNRLIQSDSSYFITNPAIRVHYFSVLSFRTENLGSGEIRVAAESSSIIANTGITLIRNNIDQLLIQGSSAVNLRVRSGTQFPGITFTSKDYYSLNSFDDDIQQYGRIIRYGVLNFNGLINFSSHANSDSQTSFRSSIGTRVNSVTSAVWSAAGDFDIRAESNLFLTSPIVNIESADDVNFFYTESISITPTSTTNIVAAPITPYNNGAYDATAHNNRIVFNGRHNTNAYRVPIDGFEDQSPGRPKVTINPGLNQFFVTNQFANTPDFARPVARGGACLFERAIGFAKDQGVSNICICLDKVWLCSEPLNRKDNRGNAASNTAYNLPAEGPYNQAGPL